MTLHELTTLFGLQFVEDEQFFQEWQEKLPNLSEDEKQHLNRVKASYTNLVEFPPLLENTIKMVILSPLLDLAGFYLPPFRIRSEESVEISAVDDGAIVKGQIDVLVIADRFWVVAIESKKLAFSLEAGRPQLLSYMLASPHPEKPVFGLITNGSSFRFVKLLKQPSPRYALSKVFDLLNPGNDLYQVLQILKRLGQLFLDRENLIKDC